MELLNNQLNGLTNLSKFRMVRMGDKDDVVKSYKELIDVYRRVYGETLAHIDPTDVFLYKKDEASNIISNFYEWCAPLNVKSLKKGVTSDDFETAVNIKKNLVLNYCKQQGDTYSPKPLWNCDFISLSLKQLEDKYLNSVDRYNMFSEESRNVINISNIRKSIIKDGNELTHRTERSISVTIKGTYNFDYGIGERRDNDDDFDSNVTQIAKREETIKLTMRSFSSSGKTNNIDLLLAHGPTLGKCSKTLMMDLLNMSLEETKSLNLCLDKFEEKVKEWYDNNDAEPFIQIIKSCSKNSEICVPFVLIH